MKTLIVVDFQKDFANPNGTLYVPEAEKAEDGICNYIIEHHKEISDVVFTVDWHTFDDLSFKVNGGQWPIHCVQYTEGASISKRLFSLCNYYKLNIKVFQKGDVPEHEEYGAFEKIKEYISTGIYVENFAENSGMVFDSKNIVVCGLAGDFCVKETINNLLKLNELNIEVLKNGIASIDNGETLDNFIKENNLKVI